MSHAALLIPTLDRIGGAESQVMLLASGMCSRGWRVTVVALSGSGGEAARSLRDSGIDFVTLEMRKGVFDPRGWIRLHRWLASERPDVVHAHLPHAAWMARGARLCLRPHRLRGTLGNPASHAGSSSSSAGFSSPVFIDTLHSSSCGTLTRRLTYRATDWLADRVTAVSRSVANTHLQAGMVARHRLSVVPNGVDVNRFRPDLSIRSSVRRSLGLGSEFVWLAVGRLDEVKDYPTLLNAFSRLPEPAKLLIAGQGPMQDALATLTARLGIEHRVRFLGFQSDVRPFLQAADAFVLSSRWEGLPISLLEAGASGLPSVATDVPGTREVLVHGRTGLLTPPGATAALARTMTMLMQASVRERRSMGNLARMHVSEQFGIEAILDRWTEIYSELLHAARRPSPIPFRPQAAEASLSSRELQYHKNRNVLTIHSEVASAIPATPNQRISSRFKTMSSTRLTAPQ